MQNDRDSEILLESVTIYKGEYVPNIKNDILPNTSWQNTINSLSDFKPYNNVVSSEDHPTSFENNNNLQILSLLTYESTLDVVTMREFKLV